MHSVLFDYIGLECSCRDCNSVHSFGEETRERGGTICRSHTSSSDAWSCGALRDIGCAGPCFSYTQWEVVVLNRRTDQYAVGDGHRDEARGDNYANGVLDISEI